jgi:hypothetical protein
VAESVDARDLKSLGSQLPCGFESRPGHSRSIFAWDFRWGSSELLRRHRPGDLVSLLYRELLTHGRLARSAGRSRLQLNPGSTSGHPGGQGKCDGLIGRRKTEAADPPFTPAHIDVHVHRVAILDPDAGLVGWRGIAGSPTMAGGRKNEE